MRIITGVRARDAQDHEAARIRNYELANLTIFAQHDPKKMPKYEAGFAKRAPVSDEAQQARARGAFIALALRSKG